MPWKTAARMIAPPRDGLSEPWTGRVWLNPPFGNRAAAWLAKLAAHGNGVALIPARTETRMFYSSVWPKADAVLFLYREEYYLSKEEPSGGAAATNTKWHEWQNELRECAGVVELIAAKVRQGAPGTVKVYMELETNTVVADKKELELERML
jgi:hypothetical protein